MKWWYLIILAVVMGTAFMSFAVSFQAATSFASVAKSLTQPAPPPPTPSSDDTSPPLVVEVIVSATNRLPVCNEALRRQDMWLLAKDGTPVSDDLLFCKKNQAGEYQWHFQPMIPVVEKIQ